MTEIEKHIISLLLTNDCVIVPGFGGFITHHACAVYDEASHTFYPPMRTLGFNHVLTMNDSLLAQSYAEAHGISYQEAQALLEDDVNTLRSTLEERGSYEINGLGMITINNDDGRYEFEPCVAGLLTPSLFGLSSFAVKKIACDAVEEQDSTCVTPLHVAETTQTQEEITDDPEEKPARRTALIIPIDILGKVAVACVAILLFFLFPSPVGNSGTSIRMGNIDTDRLLRIMPKSVTMGSAEIEKTVNDVKNEETANVTEATNEADCNTVSETEYKYTVILASKVSRKNADKYVSTLKSRGYSEAWVMTQDGITRVAYDKFREKDDALKTRSLLSDNIEFADAWILRMK